MLMPVSDDNRDRRIIPIVNYLIILANIFVFVYFQELGNNIEFIYSFSTVPMEIITGKDIITDEQTYVDISTGNRYEIPGLQPTPIFVYLTILTSMFMHGGLAHIFGNMLYLWIFGDNIENRIGHFRYLIFYLLCGIVASLAHVFSCVLFDNSLLTPSLGASGAISGVLGGYLLLFPARRVRVIMFYSLLDVPAIFAIGMWFLFQVINGIGLLGGQDSGIAYGAHIGGFLAGFLLVTFFTIGRRY
ncbi:rhomboid family intramembrane serine protease [Ignavibacterium sp.]|uniref:rhomboid family intramembrane serine protease n=1 Tax=Ignavibacterium sp. TaxID=2651167 RepID=UPI00307D8CD3